MNNRLITLALTILMVGQAFGSRVQPHSRLMGGWQLKDFVIISADGDENDYCEGQTGQIQYSENGFMSVAINCAEASRMLFYAGKFEIKGDEVLHHVSHASSPALIGKMLVRKVAQLSNTELVLTGPLGDQGETIRIAWTREATANVENDETIAYLTHLKLKPGTEAAFKQEVAKIVKFSRSEPGNVAWFVQQGVEDPTEIVFYTRWINQAAIEWHLNAPPLKNYIEKSGTMLERPALLKKYRPLDLLK